jgi:hypothetical protein
LCRWLVPVPVVPVVPGGVVVVPGLLVPGPELAPLLLPVPVPPEDDWAWTTRLAAARQAAAARAVMRGRDLRMRNLRMS